MIKLTTLVLALLLYTTSNCQIDSAWNSLMEIDEDKPISFLENYQIDFDGLDFVKSIHSEFHKQFGREYMPQILSESEMAIYNETRIEVVSKKLSPFIPAKSFKDERIIQFNNGFFIDLIKYHQLVQISNDEKLNRKYFEVIYSMYFKHIYSETLPQLEAKLNSLEKSRLLDPAFLSSRIMYMSICLFYVEMHEFYHICYDETKNSLENEIRADNFAIDKLTKFVSLYLNTQIRKPNGKADLIKSKELKNLCTNTLIHLKPFHDYLTWIFLLRPHKFTNSIKALTTRTENLYKNIFNICGCNDHESDVDCRNLLSFTKPTYSNLEIDNLSDKYEMLDAAKIEDISVLPDLFYKLSLSLVNGEKEEVETCLDTILKHPKSVEKDLELALNIKGQIAFSEGKRENAIELLSKAKEFSINLPKSYYEIFIEEVEGTNQRTVIEELQSNDSSIYNKYSELSENCNSLDCDSLMISYVPHQFPDFISQFEYGTYIDNSGITNRKTFISQSVDSFFFVFRGIVDNSIANGQGFYWDNFSCGSDQKQFFIYSNFKNGEINDLAIMRETGDTRSGFIIGEFSDGYPNGDIVILTDDNREVLCKLPSDIKFSISNVRQYGTLTKLVDEHSLIVGDYIKPSNAKYFSGNYFEAAQLLEGIFSTKYSPILIIPSIRSMFHTIIKTKVITKTDNSDDVIRLIHEQTNNPYLRIMLLEIFKSVMN